MKTKGTDNGNEQVTDKVNDKGGNLLMVERGRIGASGTNPRKHFPEEGLRELGESIRAHGVLQPLVVRPVPAVEKVKGLNILDRDFHVVGPDEKGKWHLVDEYARQLQGFDTKAEAEAEYKKRKAVAFELVCGERRWRAAGLAGVEVLPCIVRTLTDEEVLEIQLIENLQREDVTALEEARGYVALVDGKRYTPESLAAKLGKSRSYVFGRLRLARSLSAKALKVLEEMGQGQFPGSIAELIATVPEQLQVEAARAVRQGGGHNYQTGKKEPFGLMSYRQAKEEIERRFRVDLGKANFNKGDGNLLKGCPSCVDCPKRSGNMDPATKSPNVCTDPPCFEKKQAASGMAYLDAKRALGCEVIEPDAWYGGDYKMKSAYKDLGDEAWEYGQGRKTIKQMLGKALEALPPEKLTFTLDRDWQAVELVRVADLAGLLKAAGVKSNRGGNENAAWKAQQAKERAKTILENKVADAVAGEVVSLCENKGAEGLAQCLAEACVESCWHDSLGLIAKRRYPEEKTLNAAIEKLRSAAPKMTTAQCRGLAVEVLCLRGLRGSWHVEGKVEKKVLALYGVNKSKVAARVKRELEQKKKGKRGQAVPDPTPTKGAKKVGRKVKK